jgi:solute carrier family 25 phosphate transporter 3
MEHIFKHPSTFGVWAFGVGPTGVGYALHGALKFGFYEYTKKKITEIAGEEAAFKSKTALYVTSAVIAESVASTILCPWEALRIRSVSQPEIYKYNMAKNFATLTRSEGVIG